ncbi:MAG TPA: 1-(5-phosphoribosyl)-5-[(5-phosphoribosylamino)methylideneamino] imidazole-4-carboxamide isomerase [Pyrinomonadaceae bacterium]|nr:1-(5-phosphoribosyl)-5-[(5-phosphoribosylamino)methylideneamino] imidazole-4-carboxamide isomerase [Pyrinomonadaceae bacterium]
MIEVIPAIDIIGGRCVRLTEGDFRSIKIYDASPLDMAKRFEDAGLRRLHIVDLDGAKVGHPANLTVLELIASSTGLTVDFGGGIKTDDDIAAVFDAGAAMASIGSVAARSPEVLERWLATYGGERILLGADARDGRVAIDGWQTETELEVVRFLRGWCDKGVTQAFVTDISKDGGLAGPGLVLYEKILAELPELNLIASGGVAELEDIERLDAAGCSGVIVGKAIYEGRIELEELSKYAG